MYTQKIRHSYEHVYARKHTQTHSKSCYYNLKYKPRWININTYIYYDKHKQTHFVSFIQVYTYIHTQKKQTHTYTGTHEQILDYRHKYKDTDRLSKIFNGKNAYIHASTHNIRCT